MTSQLSPSQKLKLILRQWGRPMLRNHWRMAAAIAFLEVKVRLETPRLTLNRS